VSATSRTAATEFVKSFFALTTPESFIPQDLTVSCLLSRKANGSFPSITLESGLDAHRGRKMVISGLDKVVAALARDNCIY
jgi:hypothetical protein